jgi:hypothetical protein
MTHFNFMYFTNLEYFRPDFSDALLKSWVEGSGDYQQLGSLHSRLKPLETKLGTCDLNKIARFLYAV